MAFEPTYTTHRTDDMDAILAGAFPAGQQSDFRDISTQNEPSFGVEPWIQDVLNEDPLTASPLDLHSNCDGLLLDSGSSSQMFPVNDSFPSTAEMASTYLDSTHNSSFASFFEPQNTANTLDFPHSFPGDILDLSFDQPLLEQEHHQLIDTRTDVAAVSDPVNSTDNSQSAFHHVAAAFKDLARAQAASDPRPVSRKQKLRDASIALYLERLRDACDDAVAVLGSTSGDSRGSSAKPQYNPFSSDSLGDMFEYGQAPMELQNSSASESNFSASFDNFLVSDFSSPRSSSASYPAQSPQSFRAFTSTPASESSSKPQQSAPAPVTGGVEMVMDLNMNTATALPRKHRPRTQAQRDRYLAVRNRGACEKHKKQHKRCTCVDQMVSTTPSKRHSPPTGRNGAECGATATRRISIVESMSQSGKAVGSLSSALDYNMREFGPGDCVGSGGSCECDNCQKARLRLEVRRDRHQAPSSIGGCCAIRSRGGFSSDPLSSPVIPPSSNVRGSDGTPELHTRTSDNSPSQSSLPEGALAERASPGTDCHSMRRSASDMAQANAGDSTVKKCGLSVTRRPPTDSLSSWSCAGPVAPSATRAGATSLPSTASATTQPANAASVHTSAASSGQPFSGSFSDTNRCTNHNHILDASNPRLDACTGTLERGSDVRWAGRSSFCVTLRAPFLGNAGGDWRMPLPSAVLSRLLYACCDSSKKGGQPDVQRLCRSLWLMVLFGWLIFKTLAV